MLSGIPCEAFVVVSYGVGGCGTLLVSHVGGFMWVSYECVTHLGVCNEACVHG